MKRQRLKSARKAAGMTQQQMADRLGITLRQYNNIESGASVGTVGLWDTLEDIFEVNQRVLRAMYPGKEDSQ